MKVLFTKKIGRLANLLFIAALLISMFSTIGNITFAQAQELQTGSWLPYTDAKFYFSFEYPSDWQIDYRSDAPDIYGESLLIHSNGAENEVVKVYIGHYLTKIQDDESLLEWTNKYNNLMNSFESVPHTIISTSELIINGKNAVEVVSDVARYTNIKSGNLVWFVGSNDIEQTANSTNLDIYNHIVSTLVFTPLSPTTLEQIYGVGKFQQSITDTIGKNVAIDSGQSVRAASSNFRLPFVGFHYVTLGPTCPPTHSGGSAEAIDYGLNYEDVISSESGEVVLAVLNTTGFGYSIKIDHGGGYTSRYAHLSALYVNVGAEVNKGTTLAVSGNTGNSTGAHLHFEIQRNGNAYSVRNLPGQTLYNPICDPTRWYDGEATGPVVIIPPVFSKISPSNGATDLDPNNVTISWNAYTGADFYRYRYCYYTDHNSANCDSDGGVWTGAYSNTSVILSGLQSNKTYYWHVQAVLNDNTKVNSSGDHWSFATALGAPAAFSKIEPINSVIKTALPVTLQWGASSGVETYYYCVDPLPCTPSIPVGTATSVSWSPSPEPAGGIATYYWQVKAVNSKGETWADGGADGSFIIDIKPGAFAKTGPASGTQASMTPTLSWDVSTKAASYEYCISETQNCSSSWVNVGNTNSKTLSTPLNASTNYYWQVRAKNSTITTEANGGTWWSFTTVPLPGAFGKTSPINNATDQPLSPTLTWSASAGATSYEYCYSSAPGPCTQWNPVGTNTSVTLSGLAADYTYYWQVRAINISGPTQANSGGWWSFTTTSVSACTFAPHTVPEEASFVDVPMEHWAWNWIERFKSAGLTTGCAWVPGGYCPADNVNREQMAVFIMRAKHCGSYTPTPVTSAVFTDVPANHWAAGFIRDFRDEKITTGCAWVPGGYCPGDNVTREQMAVFIIRAKHGGTYSPPAVTGAVFSDVPADHWAASFIKQLYDEGITTGCAWVPGGYCPGDNVTREQMAVFIGKAFNLLP